ncbi:MAG: DUF4321 domain-containing protein [Elusimicrobia bacterium]|nr:DUF4321 domain-containing protein [Elusimicrobiota bacterium]
MPLTARNVVMFGGVLVVGALIGSFLGAFLGMMFPIGPVHDLFSQHITAGLEPMRLNLQVVELTLGCVVKLNMTSILGILASAFLFRTLLS